MSKATSRWLLNVIWNNFHWADWIRLLVLTVWIKIGLDAHTDWTKILTCYLLLTSNITEL